MTHEEICTYEVCKLAKEKGFPQHPNKNGKCRIYTLDKSKNTYVLCDWAVWISAPWAGEVIAAPTQSLLQRWLRDNGFGEVEVRHYSETNKYPHHYGWEVKDNLGVLMSYSSKMFATYELALEQALKYSLENLC